jgi:hypothetical protein
VNAAGGVLLPGDLEALADKIDQLKERKTGRKGRDLRKLAIDWAHLYRKARREGIKDPGLVPWIDSQLEATIDMTTDAERPGRDIGRSAVEKAKARFRPFIGRIQFDPESDIFPAPEEGLG